MLALQPVAPWRATYRDTAVAIDTQAHASPLYDDADGVARTAALLVATAWFESRFDPQAVDDEGSTFCLGQVDPRGLFATPQALLHDVPLCVGSMLRLMHESVRVCALRGRAADERLGQYTGGGGACNRGLRESRLRMRLAAYLLRAHPVRWIERTHPMSETKTTTTETETTTTAGAGGQGGQSGGQPKPGQGGTPGPQPGTTHPQPGSTQPQPGQGTPKGK